MKIKNYLMVCLSCSGSGFINSPYPTSTSTQELCPACRGSKVVMVTETSEIDNAKPKAEIAYKWDGEAFIRKYNQKKEMRAL